MKRCVYDKDDRLKKECRELDQEFERLCRNFLKKHKKYKTHDLGSLMFTNLSCAISMEVLKF